MGLDVQIPATFNASGLLLRPGWEDDFNRPDSATLGSTTVGNRPWRVLAAAGANITPQIESQQLAASGTAGFVLASADAGTPDVRVEATVSGSDRTTSLTPNLRLAVRCIAADTPHFVSLRWTNVPGGERLTLNSYVPGRAGVTVNSAVLGNLEGKRIALEAIGDAYGAYLDGVRVIAPQIIPGLVGATHHGVQANNSANRVRLDSMVVTRA